MWLLHWIVFSVFFFSIYVIQGFQKTSKPTKTTDIRVFNKHVCVEGLSEIVFMLCPLVVIGTLLLHTSIHTVRSIICWTEITSVNHSSGSSHRYVMEVETLSFNSRVFVKNTGQSGPNRRI